MTQESLQFEPSGKVRHSDPVTSGIAANEVKVRPQEEAILELLRANKHGLTADEMAQKCQLPLNSISTRMKRMVDLGLIETIEVPNDEGGYCKLTRETRSGRKAMVYKIA